ncbi:hypothetical protein KSP39_PZI006814 [Platanthera zijinensis]|uniref:Integrase catalytic domain-containing protein n=1 Tax=Platanthera zijinensis TaxID=2320716 RepID=A0AAP0GA96_9ASPA
MAWVLSHFGGGARSSKEPTSMRLNGAAIGCAEMRWRTGVALEVPAQQNKSLEFVFVFHIWYQRRAGLRHQSIYIYIFFSDLVVPVFFDLHHMATSHTSQAFAYTQTGIPVFEGDAYDYWSKQMRIFFLSQGLWDLVQNGYSQSPASTSSTTSTSDKAVPEDLAATQLTLDNQKRDAKALLCIQQGVGRTILPLIIDATTSQEAWEILKLEYRGSERVISIRLTLLWRDFDNLIMNTGESVQSYFSRTTSVVNQIRTYGDDLPEKRIVSKILSSLTVKFDHVVAAIEEAKDITRLSTAELMSSLLGHEERMKRKEVQIEQAFQSQLHLAPPRSDSSSSSQKHRSAPDRAYAPYCKLCNKSTHHTKDCQSRCKRCKRNNHLQRDCWYKDSKPQEEANFTQQHESLFYSSLQPEAPNHEIWFLDSGCSNHMSNNKHSFVHLSDRDRSEVIMGDGHIKTIEGRGTVAVTLRNGVVNHIHDVQYVPGLSQNLLSVGQLLHKGYKLIFEGNECIIWDTQKEQLITVVKMSKNRIFPISMPLGSQNSSFEASSSIANTATSHVDSMLWHFRCGHLNFGDLVKLKTLVHGVTGPISHDGVCVVCAENKIHRTPFPQQATWRATRPLELVHADIWGPATTPTWSQNRFYLLLIDDFSRMCWIYFLPHKSDAFQTFCHFKALVENEIDHKIKCLRTDRGGEFLSTEFNQFCESRGIKRHLTVPYCPQQNGVVERKNRTVVEMGKSLLQQRGLPKQFWGEAMHTAVHIINRAPTKALTNSTPYETWYKRKPSIHHFKIFGSIAYALTTREHRDKLEKKGEKCIMVGYSQESKGYRLYNPITQRLIISRDTIFDEDKSWDWNAVEDQTPLFLDFVEDAAEDPSSDSPSQPPNPPSVEESSSDDRYGSSSPKKFRSLTDIYESCNVALICQEPTSFAEAISQPQWAEAMKSEIHMISKNNTWMLVNKPPQHSIIGLKWIFKLKLNEDGKVQKHKARLVARGFSQKPGRDFTETFAPVARMETIRILLAFAAQQRLQIHQLDVKSAFLNGDLNEDIYVQQPEGFVVQGEEEKVYKLRKALYGLRQAPRAWNDRIDQFLTLNQYARSPYEASLYYKHLPNNSFLIVCIYVDDLLVIGSNSQLAEEFKTLMKSEFEMSDLGPMKYFLGLQIDQIPGAVFVHQSNYLQVLLKRFGMQDCKPTATPMATNERLLKEDGEEKISEEIYRSIVGSLIYLTNSRPDIEHAVGMVSRFVSAPSSVHMKAVKRIFRYLQGTCNYGLMYTQSGNEEEVLIGFSDSDWAGSADDRKSTSGFVFQVGGKSISWNSKKQQCTALSSAEAEYIAIGEAAKEGVWLKRILEELRRKKQEPTLLMVDSTSAMSICKNPVFHNRTKHIQIKHHFVRELVEEKEIALMYCNTKDQLADGMTKALTAEKFQAFRARLGVISGKEALIKRGNVGE